MKWLNIEQIKLKFVSPYIHTQQVDHKLAILKTTLRHSKVAIKSTRIIEV